jgi:hypothetical protein
MNSLAGPSCLGASGGANIETSDRIKTLQNLPNGLHGRFFRIARSLVRGSPKLTKLEGTKNAGVVGS